jgi:fatty-acyl-CoA synthase
MGELVTALIVASDPALTEEELIAHWTRLAGYKCPKRIVFVDSLPMTATGKLQVMSLPHRCQHPVPVSVWTKDRSG